MNFLIGVMEIFCVNGNTGFNLESRIFFICKMKKVMIEKKILNVSKRLPKWSRMKISVILASLIRLGLLRNLVFLTSNTYFPITMQILSKNHRVYNNICNFRL